MGDGFTVDLGQLGSLITNLEDAKESMTSADNALKDASARDLGSTGLDGAGAAFAHRWGYGIGKIAHMAGQMTTGLEETRRNYQDADDAIADAFSGGGATSDTGTGLLADVSSAIAQRLSGGPR